MEATIHRNQRSGLSTPDTFYFNQKSDPGGEAKWKGVARLPWMVRCEESGDFRNDGWQDVVCLDRAELPGLNTHAHFCHNDHGTFRLLKTADTGLDASGISGEAADLNGDGLLDVVFAADPMNSSVGRKPEPERFQSKVFLNTGAMGGKANHWLHLKFIGTTDAELIGARVEVSAEGKKQTRWIHSNHSYKSGGRLDSHFGLGKATNADVTVILPSGKQITVADIKADQYLELDLKSNNSTKVLQP